MNNLVAIKCPFSRKSNSDNKIYLCNRICVKVAPGSKGEAMCRSCHLCFEFEVDSQSKDTINIRVKNE